MLPSWAGWTDRFILLMWLAYSCFHLLMFIRLNLGVRLSNLLHQLSFGWGQRICMDSDFWPSQLLPARYYWLSFFLLRFSLSITSHVLHWRSNSKFLLPVWYFFLANLSIWYLFSSHGCLFLSINKKIHAMPLLFTLLMSFTFYFSVMEV